MVIQDINEKSRDFRSDAIWPVASPVDRMLAFFLDFLILSPIVGLFSAVYLRDLRLYGIYDASVAEIRVTFILLVLTSVVMAVLLQSLFLVLWQATPGQRFLYLKVVHFHSHNSEKVTWGQALSRSFSWWFGGLLLLLPNLEILSHPLRRGFHDRISDTILINSKGQNSRPLQAEKKFITSWLYMFFSGLSIALFVFFLNLENQTLEGTFTFAKNLSEGLLCEEISANEFNYEKRLDEAISLFLTGNISPACLQKESDFVLWQKQSKFHTLAYFAKALLTEKSNEQDFYESKICVSTTEKASTTEECNLVHFLKSEKPNRADELRKSGLKLKSSRVLLLQESIAMKKYESALALIDDLMQDSELEATMNKYYVRVIWELSQTDSNKKTRQPASEKPSGIFAQKAIKTFKERFEIQ